MKYYTFYNLISIDLKLKELFVWVLFFNYLNLVSGF